MSRPCREAERRVFRLLHGPQNRSRLAEIHTHLLRHNLHQSNQILAHFVSVCSAINKMAYATRIFSQTPHPNILLFNAMIKGHSLCGPFIESSHLFSRMRSRDIWPDQYTFAPLIKSCSGPCDVKIGESIHAEIIVMGFHCYSSIRIGIVEMYTSHGKMKEAMKAFDEMFKRDVVVWNLIIRGFCKMGDVEMGLCLFRKMTERSVVSWNAMIASLEQSGRDKEALELFQEMRNNEFEPDDATVVTIMPVCARIGDIDAGQWLHSYADSSGLIQNFIAVGNSIINFYCKCGNPEMARKVFNEMPQKNVVSWNTIISGLALNGKGELGVDLFEEMISADINPNDASFVGVLACCVHEGLVERGRELFASMKINHQIEPKLEHYGCMVDILGRNGCVKEAYGLIQSMPMKPNAALWGALLCACHNHGETELAECVIKEVIRLEPLNSGNYVLLSNIYAEGGKWDEVEKVRVLMREQSVKKGPGHSAVG